VGKPEKKIRADVIQDPPEIKRRAAGWVGEWKPNVPLFSEGEEKGGTINFSCRTWRPAQGVEPYMGIKNVFPFVIDVNRTAPIS